MIDRILEESGPVFPRGISLKQRRTRRDHGKKSEGNPLKKTNQEVAIPRG